MSSITAKPKSWADFVTNHPSAAVLDSKYKELLKSSFALEKREDTFRSLKSSPATVMISYDERGKQIRLTHNHAVLGDRFSGNERNFVGISGLNDYATAVEFQTGEFQTSRDTPVPLLASFIKAEVGKEILPSTTRSSTKAKIRNSFILPPFLVQIAVKIWLDDFKLKPLDFLHSTIDHITSTLTNESDSDDDIAAIFTIFEPLLQFLWVISSDDDTAKTIAVDLNLDCRVCESFQLIDWNTNRCKLYLHSAEIPTAQSDDTSSKALTLFAKELRRQRYGTETDDEGLNYSKYKRSFDSVVKDTILGASSREDKPEKFPTDYSDLFKELLCHSKSCSTRQAIARHIASNHFHMELGLATKIHLGTITKPACVRDIEVPGYFSPLYTPSIEMVQKIDDDDQIKLRSSNLQMSTADTEKLTTMTPRVPSSHNTFLDAITNFWYLCEALFGDKASLTRSILDIKNYADEEKMAFLQTQQRVSHSPYGTSGFYATLMDIITRGVNTFLNPCGNAKGDLDRIDFDEIDFEDIIKSMTKGLTSHIVPSWFTARTSIQHSDSDESSVSKDRRKKSNKRKRSRSKNKRDKKKKPDKKSKKEVTCEVLPSLKRIVKGFNQYKLMHPNNCKNFEGNPEPASICVDDKEVCHKFHLSGKCDKYCKRFHGEIPSDILPQYENLVEHAKRKYEEFVSNQNDDSSSGED